MYKAAPWLYHICGPVEHGTVSRRRMARIIEAVPDRWLPRGEALVEGSDRFKPVVVWSGIPGEAARIKLKHVGQNQVRAEWLDARTPHPQRVEPPCDKYRRCGGCPWMHLSGEGQLDARRERVVDLFQSAELGNVQVGDVHPSPDGLEGYRHVVKVGFGRSESGRLKVGAWARGTRDIVPIPGCLAAPEVLRRIMMSLAHHAIELGLTPYDPETESGVLRSAVLRASRTTGEVLVTLVAARRDRNLGALAEEVARGVNQVVGVWLHLNAGPGNAIYQRDGDGVVGASCLGGKDWIEERLNDIAYRIGPGDFFQTNPGMAEVLYRRVLDRLELQSGEPVLDLYCGVGGLALPAARETGFAIGVEEIEGAVHRAQEAARINRVPAEFVCDGVLTAVPDLAGRLDGAGVKVVVDPARRGLEDGVFERIVALSPARIAYVSCNPDAMARDLADAVAQGWRVQGEIELFDMFPNTAHVELLAILDPPQSQPRPSRRGPKRRLVR